MTTTANTFDFIPDSERIMYTTAFDAITQLELWPFMRDFPDGEHFMCSSAPEIDWITERISQLGYDGHSGTSFGLTMRDMEYIGKHGFDEFKVDYQIKAQRRLERQQREREEREAQQQQMWMRQQPQETPEIQVTQETQDPAYYINLEMINNNLNH
jgi:hypothetical protein